MSPASKDIPLAGCRPEPLMAYLKALGILRLVSEQKDPQARGWWQDDVFWLRSSLDRDGLITFFLREYRPTPIVAPWGGGSGFFKKVSEQPIESPRPRGRATARRRGSPKKDLEPIDLLCCGWSPRVRPYVEVIQQVRQILCEEGLEAKPKTHRKSRLIRRFRRELPDEVVAWMDAAMVLQQEGEVFAPLLGTGGNDGRLDFTQNFIERIVSLALHEVGTEPPESRAWLDHALFALPTLLRPVAVGQFAPGRAGGPNATQGLEGAAFDNPWDFVLMMEGALVFAGAAVRRLKIGGPAMASFPFTVRTVASGYDTAASTDERGSRGETWLPIWTRPTSAGEIRLLFGEGRAEVSGRVARDGLDFARAVASLGVDRGIVSFSRVGFLMRAGKAFLASPLGRMDVVERADIDLLREADVWVSRFRRVVSDDGMASFRKSKGAQKARAAKAEGPPRFKVALHRLDSSVFEFCKYGGASNFQNILVALGAAERVLASTQGQIGQHQPVVPPLSGLSQAWIDAADDGSCEFAIARALASVDDPKIGPLRANLEPVAWKKRCSLWAEKERAVVWNTADLASNLANVLERRVMDGARAGCKGLPIASPFVVSLETVAAFLDDRLDDRRIEDLLWGLILVPDNRRGRDRPFEDVDVRSLPRAYALLKLLFLPRPLLFERGADGRLSVRLLWKDEDGGVSIRPEPSLLRLLRGGRLGEACAIAMRRLRASGLNPLPCPISGRRVRDGDWGELDGLGHAGVDVRRLAAALLLPIEESSLNRLVRLVIRCDEDDLNELASHFQGGISP